MGQKAYRLHQNLIYQVRPRKNEHGIKKYF